MPWSEKQNHLFRAIAHGWKPPAGSGIHIKRSDAARMASEGVKAAGGGSLVDLLRSLPRSERFDALTRHPLTDVSGENDMFNRMKSEASPLLYYGGMKDPRLGGAAGMMPNRRRWVMFDTSRPDDTGHATELGSSALMMKWPEKGEPGRWTPEGIVDIEFNKALRGQGYGRESLATLLSNMKNENDRFPMYDVQPRAKKIWEAMGAQMQDPSRPYINTTGKRGERNNNYYLTPGDFLDSLKAEGGLAAYADGGLAQLPASNAAQDQPAFRNLDLSSIESMKPISGFAAGGSIQDQADQMGPRAAAIARINEQIQRSMSPTLLGSRAQLPRRSMPMLSAYGRDYQNVLDSRLTPIGQYPRGYAHGGHVIGRDGDFEGLRNSMGTGFHSNDFGLDPDWAIQAHYDQDVGFYADGGKAEEGGAAIGDALPLLAFLRARHINALARPFARALAKPVLGIEAVSKGALSAPQSRARFDLARDAADSEFSRLPVHEGQGAWMGEHGMEFNPLYMQEFPRTLGRVRNYDEALKYGAQMGENLEQAATPVSRFVPNLINTSEGSDALQVSGMDNAKMRRLAELLGPEVVAAHRPGNKAMVFSIGDKRTPKELGDVINADMGFPGIRYGRSEPGLDRVLMTREPADWADLSYSDAGARPRSEAYGTIENRILDRLRDRRGLYQTARGAK